MSSNSSRRRFNPSTSKPSTAEGKDGEKTIPFLRRLTDMLQENDEIISFHPGVVSKKNGQPTSGKIIVHDRAKVESEILPRYFNHASFASLRRQLNYFAFCRVGKGKQRGAIYCNDQVIELEDILKLKRRVVGSATQSTSINSQKETKPLPEKISQQIPKERPVSMEKKHFPSTQTEKNIATSPEEIPKPRMNKKRKNIVGSIVPVIHLPKRRQEPKTTKQFNTFISKISPPPSVTGEMSTPKSSMLAHTTSSPITQSGLPSIFPSKSSKEPDILDGCNALLSLGFRMPSS